MFWFPELLDLGLVGKDLGISVPTAPTGVMPCDAEPRVWEGLGDRREGCSPL